jgi:hypothetical protein
MGWARKQCKTTKCGRTPDAQGTNAWTDVDHTAYTITTAGR